MKKSERMMAHTGSLLLLLLLIVESAFPFSGSGKTGQAIRENQVLRQHFTSQVSRSHGSNLRESEIHRLSSSSEVERRVDHLIDWFTNRLKDDLKEIDAALQTVAAGRTLALNASADLHARRSALRLWQIDIKNLADDARDLRRTLAYPLAQLDGKCKFKPEFREDGIADLFSDQVRFLQIEVRKATSLIEAYFFGNRHLIHVYDLRSGNMLITLHRVEVTAKALEKTLRAEVK